MISQELKDQIEKEATEYSRRIRQESGIYTFKDCYTTAATKYAEQLEEKEVERAKEQQRGDWFESEFNRMVANKKHEDRELAQLKEIAEKVYKTLKEFRNNAAEAGEIQFPPKAIDYFDNVLKEYENLKL